MEIVDATGKPRPDIDVEAALQAVKLWMIRESLAKGPDGVPKLMHLIVVKDALEELLARRQAHGNAER